MTISLVAAVGSNGVIAADGHLPWHIPQDLMRFKRLTMGHPMLMGRVTYESIGRPLPGRTSVVITTQPDWSPPSTTGEDGKDPRGGDAGDILVAHSLREALDLAAALDDDVFVVGGGKVYSQTLDLADVLELTEIDLEPEGDVVFPRVDWSRWREVAREEHPGYAFATYHRTGGVGENP